MASQVDPQRVLLAVLLGILVILVLWKVGPHSAGKAIEQPAGYCPWTDINGDGRLNCGDQYCPSPGRTAMFPCT